MTDGGGADTSNIAALPAIAGLGTCESARGSDADRHDNLLIEFAVKGHSRALIHKHLAKSPGSEAAACTYPRDVHAAVEREPQDARNCSTPFCLRCPRPSRSRACS